MIWRPYLPEPRQAFKWDTADPEPVPLAVLCDAQQLARHASIQTTADVYGYLDDADLERALSRMEPL